MGSTGFTLNSRIVVVLVCLLLFAVSTNAQQTSGSISGIVKDRQGAVVPGARVTLIDEERAGQRTQTSGPEGLFSFDLLTPSAYTVEVEAPGFKKWEKKALRLYANSRLGISDIVLDVGQLTETVTVEATTVQLQTESAEKSGLVTSQQMTELSIRDRNFLYLMRTIPGVSDIDGYHANVNGGRNDQNMFRLDGVSNMDMGDKGCCATWVNMDMIAEMNVVTNSATADMGSSSGAQVNVVTKSGSKEFHGNLYYFRRHESMNANSWTNNRQGTARGRDRMNQAGFTLGGPLFIPKVFNTGKEKLFFFVSEELWRNLSPSTTTLTVPTALERVGDYTQSRRNDNTAVVVLDPTNNRAAFPGNVIPSNRWNKDAQKLINLFPLPNVTDQVTYNYRQSNTSSYSDRLLQSYRVDYNLSERWRIYARYSKDYAEGGNAVAMASFEKDPAGNTMGWQVSPKPDVSSVLNITTIITPTFTNEIVMGAQQSMYHYYIDKGSYFRKSLGLTYTSPYPEAVIGDYGPRVSIGGSGLSNGPSLGTGLPYIALNTNYNIHDNVTKVLTRHTVKGGFTFELNRKDQDTWSGTNHAGNFSIGRDAQNPGDTDYPFANFLTGSFNTFNQMRKVLEGRFIYRQAEWYVSDTWKVSPNLTLDMGMRFHVIPPTYDSKMQMATFDPTLWDPTKVVKLYGYAAGGKSVDPTTGILYPSYFRGAIVPGSGDPDNGMVVAGTKGRTRSLSDSSGLLFGPRFGLAWQPKFLPKTVIRMGGGVFYDRLQGNVAYDSKNFPPITRTITLQYGNIGDITSAQGTIMTPPGLGGGSTGSGKIPMNVNFNFTVQRELPYSILLDVGYVGSFSRHLMQRIPYNEPAFGSAWLPSTQDPTRTPLYDGTTTLPVNFYRPYTGIGSMDLYSIGANGNYNGLQIQANKRMSRKLSFGVAYTWSKSMGVGGSMWATPNPYLGWKYSYGRQSYDRAQVMTANFIYYLPKVGKNGNFLDHPGIRLVLNDWQMSGVMTAQTGNPVNFSYSFSSGLTSGAAINRYYTGQERFGPRPLFVSDWNLPNDQRNEFMQFNTASFIPGSRASTGQESGFNYWSGPSTFWASPEMTFMKNVPFSKDGRRYIQFRLETYNVLNHHDYTGRSMSATFTSPTNLTLTNLPEALVPVGAANGGRFGFGALSGAANPRRLQVAIKVYF